jgi:hypothetical protein
VEDVVTDLHVLEDLRQRQRRGAGERCGAVAREQQLHARQHEQPPMHLDHAFDVPAVAFAEVCVDIVVNGIELARELLDLIRAQMSKRALDQAGRHSRTSL